MTTTTEGNRVDRLYRATTTPRLVQVPPSQVPVPGRTRRPEHEPGVRRRGPGVVLGVLCSQVRGQEVGRPGLQGLPLEGLWWAEDLSTFLTGDKSEWDWTMMLRQPDAVTDALFARLADEVAAKKSMPAARELRLITFEEGAAAQVLHVGPYATEAPTIVRLHQFIQEQGFSFDGHRHKHHEIYLGDPRRSAPDRLRTIIRQPYAAS